MADEIHETAVMLEMEEQGTDVRQVAVTFSSRFEKKLFPVSNSARSIRLEYNKWLESHLADRGGATIAHSRRGIYDSEIRSQPTTQIETHRK